MSVSYGVGAALTLDEFSLWLNLEPNAYWSRAGRLSIDAVILFGGILAVGAWGAPFFRAVQRMWGKRALLRQGPGPRQPRLFAARGCFVRVKCVDQGRVLRAVITRRLSFIEGVSSPVSCDHSSATTRKRFRLSKLARLPFTSRTISRRSATTRLSATSSARSLCLDAMLPRPLLQRRKVGRNQHRNELVPVAHQRGLRHQNALFLSLFSIGCGATSLPPEVFSSSFLRSVM
jgi:hypothetical protein